MIELYSSQSKSYRELAMQFHNFNWIYADKVLELYLRKCDEKHILAFKQYKSRIGLNITNDLEELFNKKLE